MKFAYQILAFSALATAFSLGSAKNALIVSLSPLPASKSSTNRTLATCTSREGPCPSWRQRIQLCASKSPADRPIPQTVTKQDKRQEGAVPSTGAGETDDGAFYKASEEKK